jgi:hypothetical protein
MNHGPRRLLGRLQDLPDRQAKPGNKDTADEKPGFVHVRCPFLAGYLFQSKAAPGVELWFQTA